MSAAQQEARFFVVGGPVQPDRACYIERRADELLYARLSEAEYCHVISPPDVGKSSLVAHTAGRLRQDGVAVAILDVAQISHRNVQEDVGRWYYSVAYRIVRELRIRTDLQRWWQDRAGLTNMQRLREFFLDVVLVEMQSPVVIFVDRVEAVLGLNVSRDLFGAIRACFDARATEPEARRLTFAVLGSQAVGQRIPLGEDSPFSISSAVELEDFDGTELLRLTEGLGVNHEVARELADRIWYWTSGHPYLSQKILRALARRGLKAADANAVDDVAAALFLGPNSVREEPHLVFVRQQLLRESSTKVARLSLYGKIRKGGTVELNEVLPLHREMLTTGTVVVDHEGNFAVRNRVYAEVFSALWVNQNLPFSWRGLAAVVLAATVALGLPVWYTEYLPRPYVRVLNTTDSDFVTALEAYERLSFLPGFGGTADELFTDFLTSVSRRASRFSEVQRYGDYLEQLPGTADLRRSLMAEFWDGRVRDALLRGRQDHAILFAMRALDEPTDTRRRRLGELLGEDVPSLQGTIRPGEALRDISLDSVNGLVTLLDEAHRVSVWQFGETGGRRLRTLELAAEEILPLQARAVHEGSTRGRRLSLDVRVLHPRPSDIMIELRAPSGRAARLSLQEARTADDTYSFDSGRAASLRPLLEENPNGTWTAYFIDTVQGISGSLVDWSLSIDGRNTAPAPGSPVEPTLIPQPGVARQAMSVLEPQGRRALTWPADPQVRGDVLVWSVGSGKVISRVPRGSSFSAARFALGNTAVLITTARAVELWDAERGELMLTVPVEPTLAPVLSANGRYLVVDSILDESDDNALAVWDLAERQERGRLVTGDVVALTVTDSAGRYLAVSDGNRLVRLWSVTTGRLVGEFAHASAPAGIYFDPAGEWLATEDASHTLRVWNLEAGGAPVLLRSGAAPWAVDFDQDRLLLGSLDRGFEVVSLNDGERVAPILRHGTPAARSSDGPQPGQAALAANLAVTADGEEAVKIWRLPAPLPELAETRAALPPAAGAAAIDPSGRYLAVATSAGDVRILTVGQQLVVPGGPGSPGFIGHFSPAFRLAFDPTGQTVASGAMDGSLRVWDVAGGAPRGFFANQGDGAIQDLLFGPAGDWFVTVSQASVQVIDTATGSVLARTPIQGMRPRLAIGSDGTEIFIAGDHDGMTSWNWQAQLVEPLLEIGRGVRDVAISPGGLISVARSSRRVELWTANQQRLAGRVRLPVAVDDMWFTADGSELIVRGGLWIFRLRAAGDGLARRSARVLPEAPDAGAIDPVSGNVFVLTGARSSRPQLTTLVAGQPAASPVEEAATELRPRLKAVLQLTLDEWGEPQAIGAP
ncbi:MAG: AAA-like domain-containing protein [Gammaproteobacteria bacterium]|nr:AAA-like domain-containing protein [Gammaproteobacteria bacterium]